MNRTERELDRWLTTPPESYDMERVTEDAFRDTDPETGQTYPTAVDSLECEDCETPVGWESHGGTFVEFYSDPSDKHYKCEDCHGEWLDNYYTE